MSLTLSSFVDMQVYGLFKMSVLNVIWAVTSGNRYARDDEELQGILHGLDKVIRSGFQSGRISDAFPILNRFFPRATGFKELMDNVKNTQSFMKVR
jgi:hypothetical protein